MSSTKVKIYKNPERDRPTTHKPYVPQYQIMGVEPAMHKTVLPASHKETKIFTGSSDNPRASKPLIRSQPYAEAVPSPIGVGKGPLPNIGNNMEQTWSGVDGEIVDDISLDPNQKMVDNNEFVRANALGPTDEDNEDSFLKEDNKEFLTENLLKGALEEDYLSQIINQLDEDEYCLLVEGSPMCSGSFEYIQEQTRLLIFGEHESYGGNPIPVDDILVIKRVKIRIGAFLD